MNIVFDLGGVVVRWEPDALIAEAFTDPAVRARVRRDLIDHPDWLELDRGTLPLETAVARAAERTGLPAGQLTRFMRRVPPSLTPIAGTIDLLYRLKAWGHPLFCLSNMQVASIEYLERTHAFWDAFSGKVISCRVQLCKPEPAIYAHLLGAFRLDAAETVFIDDLDVNLSAAARFGIRTIRFEDPAQCERQLRRKVPDLFGK